MSVRLFVGLTLRMSVFQFEQRSNPPISSYFNMLPLLLHYYLHHTLAATFVSIIVARQLCMNVYIGISFDVV